MTVSVVASGYVQSGTNTATSITTSLLNCIGASLIVMAWSGNYDGGLGVGGPAFSDSQGNTWQTLTLQDNGTFAGSGQFAYCINPSVASAQSFTANTAPNNQRPYQSLNVVAFGGVGAGAALLQNIGNKLATATTIQPGSLTSGGNNQLAVYMGAAQMTGTAAVNIGTAASVCPLVGGVCLGSIIAYDVLASSGTAINPTITSGLGSGAGLVASMAIFSIVASAPNTSSFFFST